MQGDVPVEGVFPQDVQMTQVLAGSSALGLTDLLTPGLTSKLHLSPEPNA